jgi:para-nitrobenzyl esterase
LLVGWNSEEGNYKSIIGNDQPTKENFEKAVGKLYPEHAANALKVYNASTEEEVKEAATGLASDRFIGFSTWKWADVQTQTGGKPVYRYLYSRPRPAMRAEMGNVVAGLAGGVVKVDSTVKKAPPATGAVHSAEIEYAPG